MLFPHLHPNPDTPNTSKSFHIRIHQLLKPIQTSHITSSTPRAPSLCPAQFPATSHLAVLQLPSTDPPFKMSTPTALPFPISQDPPKTSSDTSRRSFPVSQRYQIHSRFSSPNGLAIDVKNTIRDLGIHVQV